jgi:predicted aspartyl protease
MVDSGSADVSVPADTITQEDFFGEQTYVLADESKVPSQQFRIRSLKVGNKTIENVVASVASANATVLLGQSFLSKFKSVSFDNQRLLLILKE